MVSHTSKAGTAMQRVHELIVTEGKQFALDRTSNGTDRRTVELAANFLACEESEIEFTHPGMCLTVLPYRALKPFEEWRRNTHNLIKRATFT
jgi:hypothetical protein